MYRLWLLFDPRRALIGLWVFGFTLAALIHFILLSTERYNWFDGPAVEVSSIVVDDANTRLT